MYKHCNPLIYMVPQPATATDNVDPAPVITNDNPGPYSVGDTLVTWTATDASGNFSAATQMVTIVDTTNPMITSPADITMEAVSTGPLTPVALIAATTTDIADPAPVVTNDNPGPFPLGDTIVTWTATDASGNFATDTQRVTITPCQDLGIPLCLFQTLITEKQSFCDSVTFDQGGEPRFDFLTFGSLLSNQNPQAGSDLIPFINNTCNMYWLTNPEPAQ